MSQLVLQLVQAAAGVILNIQGSSEQQQDKLLVEWKLHFSRQFNNLSGRQRRTLRRSGVAGHQ